ncbi:hypothetical protein [uncultured Polaribacter sp.]|uniref:hypothetical protein n=1 Tax=uncultured Polaribacter sp. TaxID=174711 RepID=UPI00260CB615|nr:hypothetical protein [uncultured Polaribacter sp.]
MKQLGKMSNRSVTKRESQMLTDYWQIERENGIETFVFSENEFLKKYASTSYFKKLRSLETFAIYQVEECSVCLKPFTMVLNDRTHVKSYMQSKNKCCRICGHFDTSIKNSNTK